MQIIKGVLVVLLITMTIAMQIYASKRKSARAGLILPTMLFVMTCAALWNNVHAVRMQMTDNMDYLTSLTYFAIYNVPTILFLCIYNYCQRGKRRIM